MQKEINFDDFTKENIKEQNSSWPQIPGYRKIINNCWRLRIWRNKLII